MQVSTKSLKATIKVWESANLKGEKLEALNKFKNAVGKKRMIDSRESKNILSDFLMVVLNGTLIL